MSKQTRESTQMLRSGFRIGRVAGVELEADWSLLIIVGLIALNLGAGLFPAWHREWSPFVCWTLAIIASIVFIASIAVHELSHAIVGRRNGIPIRRITLFVFGGLAHMEREPSSPSAEFRMAIVGPLVSIAIGIAATIGALLLESDAAAAHQGHATAFAASIGPLATILLWLGPINIILGVFNLVPGFPLDGGRVLRSLLWRATGDLEKATRWAAGSGRLVGIALMAIGVAMVFGFAFPVLGGGFVQGLWLALIGWFLSNAARASYQQVVINAALTDVRVADVMRSRVDAVVPDLTLSHLVRDYIMSSDQTSFPVVLHGQLLGMVHMSDIRRAPRDKWDDLTVKDVMTPAYELDMVHADDGALDAMRQLAEHEQIPVVEGERLIGMARRQDLVKWVALHEAEKQ